MQAAEAITLLIHEADCVLKADIYTDDPDYREKIELSVAVSTAMLNSMIPVARYRVFVEVDPDQPKPKKGDKATIYTHSEFTLCATGILDIKNGLIGLTLAKTAVRVSLWEQRPTGADMISGYQGLTKTLKYRQWLEGLTSLETLPTVQ